MRGAAANTRYRGSGRRQIDTDVVSQSTTSTGCPEAAAGSPAPSDPKLPPVLLSRHVVQRRYCRAATSRRHSLLSLTERLWRPPEYAALRVSGSWNGCADGLRRG